MQRTLAFFFLILCVPCVWGQTVKNEQNENVLDKIMVYPIPVPECAQSLIPSQNITLKGAIRYIFEANRSYSTFSVQDALDLAHNDTDYRIHFPYPFWYGVNATDAHTCRSTWLAPPVFFIYCILMALFFIILRSIFNPILKWVGELTYLLPEDHLRFQENVFQAVYYIISWTITASFVLREDYYYNTLFVWEGDFPNQPLPDFVYFIYVFNMGWYLYNLYAINVGLDKKKKDFVELFIHHIVTLIMLYCSLVVGYWRLGTLVLYTHDLCDVFLQIPKIYLLYDNAGCFGKKIPTWFEILVFLPLPVSWIYFRLWMYPLKVIFPAVTDCVFLVGWQACDFFLFFTPLLLILYALQIYWFYLIVAIAYNKISGDPWDDVRDPVREHCAVDEHKKKD
eukprot:TRINITY_DN233_c0_g1_i1.p1 TRINITY_DN233_c0_g1~~TRINITY_DN233_c0_g1_i1.p1  ORF type:complete len:395 (-),score=34.90 TRINITY_DN233_c0_g1_i1:96-1280(-)